MALISVDHEQLFQGQTMHNIYWYDTPVTITSAVIEDLLQEFDDNVVDAVIGLQHTSCQSIQLIGQHFGGVTFASRALSQIGLNGDEPMQSFTALNFKLQRGNASTKSGSKRIGGLSEAWLAGNVVVEDPSIDARILAYEGVVPAILSGALGSYTPVIVRFDDTVVGGIAAFQSIASCNFLRVTTQNSRKP